MGKLDYIHAIAVTIQFYMYSFAVSSIFENSIGALGVGLAVMLGVVFLVSILDFEWRSMNMPWISLGSAYLGFGLMDGLFVHPPSWFTASVIPWGWMWIFLLMWIFSVTPWKMNNPQFQLGLATLQAGTFMLIPMVRRCATLMVVNEAVELEQFPPQLPIEPTTEGMS
jgi:hypothetical protein